MRTLKQNSTNDEWKEPATDAIDIKKGEPDADGNYPEYIGLYQGYNTYPSRFDPEKESFVFHFTDAEQNPYSIYGFTVLNRYMEKIQKGMMVRIYYTGMSKNKKGQDMHTCKVFYRKMVVTPSAVEGDAGEAFPKGVTVNKDDDIPF